MIEELKEDLKRQFTSGSMVTRIIIFNVIVFAVINVLQLMFMIAGGGSLDGSVYHDIRDFFLVKNDWLHVLLHPWSLVSSNFIHEGFFHLFWNMLLFYWFGRILADLIGNKKILPLYLLTGVFGCSMYLILMSMDFIGHGMVVPALGASASVMGIMMAAAYLNPHYEFNLIFIGPVKIMYIAALLFFIDVIALGTARPGGPIAHISGAVMGGLYVNLYRTQGIDLTDRINRWIDGISNFFGGLRQGNEMRTIKSEPRKQKPPKQQPSTSHQEKVDAILDKIKASGYESLTEEEKEFLFLASKK